MGKIRRNLLDCLARNTVKYSYCADDVDEIGYYNPLILVNYSDMNNRASCFSAASYR